MTTEEQLQEIRAMYVDEISPLSKKYSSLLEQIKNINDDLFVIREQKDKLEKETAKKILKLYGIEIGQKVCVEGEQLTITNARLAFSDLMKVGFKTEEGEEFGKLVATSEQNIKETFNLK